MSLQEILSPFSLACETKYAKLACIALSAFQKLLANDAVSNRGRCEIIKALQAVCVWAGATLSFHPDTLYKSCNVCSQAERLSDESVKLRILQASLTTIQNPNFADEQVRVPAGTNRQQLCSLIICYKIITMPFRSTAFGYPPETGL